MLVDWRHDNVTNWRSKELRRRRRKITWYKQRCQIRISFVTWLLFVIFWKKEGHVTYLQIVTDPGLLKWESSTSIPIYCFKKCRTADRLWSVSAASVRFGKKIMFHFFFARSVTHTVWSCGARAMYDFFLRERHSNRVVVGKREEQLLEGTKNMNSE